MNGAGIAPSVWLGPTAKETISSLAEMCSGGTLGASSHRHYGTVPGIQGRELLHSSYKRLLNQMGRSGSNAGPRSKDSGEGVWETVPGQVWGAAHDSHRSKQKFRVTPICQGV